MATEHERREIIAGVLAHDLHCDAPFTMERLGGLTNFNYHVVAGDLDVVFRLPGVGTEELVNRAVECEITHIASDIGADNTLLFFDPETGIKVVRYIPNAETMHPETSRDPENIQLIAEVLRLLHTKATPVSFRFDVFEMIPFYERLIAQEHGVLWEGYEEMRARVYGLKERLSEADITLCHCDPLCENFVKDAVAKRMYLVDWEYSGMNDPMWDLADVIIEGEYGPEERTRLERAYFGREATRDESERITIQMVLLDFLWALRGKQRCCFGEDLEDYAVNRFIRAQANIAKLEG